MPRLTSHTHSDKQLCTRSAGQEATGCLTNTVNISPLARNSFRAEAA